MLKKSFISRGLIFFLVLAVFTSFLYSQEKRESFPFSALKDDFALIIIGEPSTYSAKMVHNYVMSQGGRVSIVIPPHTLMGWVPPELAESLIGIMGIERISYTPLDLDELIYQDSQTLAAVTFFNAFVSGSIEEEKLSALELEERAHLINDAFEKPPLDYEAYLRNLPIGIHPNPVNSDAMTGDVALCLFFIESNGTIDPNTYTWTAAHWNDILNETIDGLNWWAGRAYASGTTLTFYIYFYDPTRAEMQQGYEPILHTSYTEDHLWINAVMTNLGYTSGDKFARLTAFNTWLRGLAGTDWAYTAVVGYNPLPAPDRFTDGYSAYAYLGGPYTQLLYRSFNWPFNKVMSHESGHIFWACDEYYQAGYGGCMSCGPCALQGPRPWALNGNCEYCNPEAIPCMMRANSDALCIFTKQHIGWISDIEECTAAINCEETVSGTWTSNCISDHRSGSYAKYYTFDGTAGQWVTIDLMSSVDTYLFLVDPSGNVETDDDDGGTGVNSRIFEHTLLSSGPYTIEATTYASGQTGSFDLSLDCEEIIEECTAAINCGDAVSGNWTINCPSDHRPGSYAKYYEFEGTAGDWVTINLMSSVDTYLYLVDPNGNVETDDDDGGTGYNSRIFEHTLLSSGIYTIEATTFASGQTGSFDLSLECGISEECTAAINCEETVPGTWTSNCPSDHRPGSYAKYYTFDGTAGQPVTIDLMSSVDTYLFLLDPSGTVEASDDDGGTGLNSRISDHLLLSSGTYTIEATTFASGQTGSFDLTLSCCVEGGFDSQFTGSAEGWEAVVGTWYIEDNAYYATEGVPGSSASASYNDTFSNFTYEARLWRDGSDTLANRIIIRGDPSSLGPDNHWNNCYLFQYARNGLCSVWKIYNGIHTSLYGWTTSTAVNTGDAWNTLKVVADGSSLQFYINDILEWSGTDSSHSSGQVGIGMYSPGSGQKLRVDWAVLTTGICDECTTAIDCGDTVPGTWTSNCPSDHRPGSYAKYFEFDGTAGQPVTIDLMSSVDTYLYLVDPSGNVEASDDDGGTGVNSRISDHLLLSSGTYTIEATTYASSQTGTFDLSLECGMVEECTAAIACGETVPGTWTSNCPSDHRPDSYAKYYTFDGTAGQPVTIDLMSSVDTYLFLLDPSGNVEASDDDGGTGTNSRISDHLLLSSGTYTIEATTYASGQTGSFDLSLSCGIIEECTAAINCGDAVSGNWTINCPSDNRSGSYAKYYEFEGTAGQWVTINLMSSVDTYLYLVDPNGNVEADDDDGGTGYNSRIFEHTLLSSGTYTIEATTFASGQTGSFDLSLDCGISEECTAAINCEETVSDTWTIICPSDHRSGRYAKYYTFDGTAGQPVTIDLMSSVDTYLFLLDPSGNVEADDDDGGTGTNSRISDHLLLASGIYTIEATTYASGQTGSFDLTLSCCVEGGFDSQFTGSAEGWEAHEGTWYIEGNAYYATDGSPGYFANSSYNDTFSNFTYEARLWREGNSSGSNSIIIRGDPSVLDEDYRLWRSCYLFQYTPWGECSVFKVDNGIYTSLYGWADSSAINMGDAWNTLKVVANGSSLQFYINDILEWAGTDSSFLSGRVGIAMYSTEDIGQKLRADWAVLTTGICDECTTAINCEETVSGNWTSNCPSDHRPGSYAKYYTFDGSAGQLVTIDLMSSVDTYLYLVDPNGNVEADDDDGGTGVNSRIFEHTLLSSGTYTIEATTYASSQTGTFDLSLECGGYGGFDSQFNGSAEGWIPVMGTWYIEDNAYYASEGSGVDVFASTSYYANFSNFQYGARLWRDGYDYSTNGIIIRGDPSSLGQEDLWANCYLFLYSRSGSYGVVKVVNGGAIFLQSWTVSPAINMGDAWNLLSVIANGSSLLFYINGTLVWSGTDASFSSGQVGIAFATPSPPGSGEKLRADWAVLLEGSFPASLTTQVVSDEQQALNAAANKRGSGSIKRVGLIRKER